MENKYSKELNELKYTLIAIAIEFFIVFSGVWHFSDKIISYIVSTSPFELITIYPFELIQTQLYITVLFTIFILFPIALLHFYIYMRSALYPKEKKLIKYTVFPSYIMFISGFLISFFLIVSVFMQFYLTFYVPDIQESSSIYNYVMNVISFSCIFGMLFCIPVIISYLTYLRIITTHMLRYYRIPLYIASMIISAILTPPDVFSMALMSVPTIFLFEISIIISYIITYKYKTTDVSHTKYQTGVIK